MTTERARIADLDIPAYWINLERRPDRRQETEAELSRVRIPAERIEAVDGQWEITEDDLVSHHRRRRDPGTGKSDQNTWRTEDAIAGLIGCVLSHQKMLDRAIHDVQEAGCPAALLMEDDVQFGPQFRPRWERTVLHAPDHWQVLVLGGNPVGRFSSVSPNVVTSPGGVYCTHAYVVKAAALRRLRSLIDNRWMDLDLQWRPMFASGEALLCWPHLAGQRRSYSDIARRTVDKFRPEREWRQPT